MINALLFKLTADLPCRLIPRVPGEPYLERYYLGRVFDVDFYLHRFLSPDEEPFLHNHPWGWGRALVLCGGYTEEYLVDLWRRGCITETHKIRWWNRVDGNHFHRIKDAAPKTWTLFFHSPRSRQKVGNVEMLKGWGFIENGTFNNFPSPGADWWLDAPTGREAGREPL